MNRIIATLLLVIAVPATAQGIEEVLVSGMRSSEDVIPGIVYKKTGDFMLMQVLVINDTREAAKRKEELYKSLKNAVAKDKADSTIELSLVEDGYVYPLTQDNYKVPLRGGSRADTSSATIRVKTAIAKKNADPTRLIEKLRSFVKTIPVQGRTEFIADSDVDVSVVNPSQYRATIIKDITQEINTVTAALGSDYRVTLEGIDKPVTWVRSGPISLSLYIPYTYSVLPTNINSIWVMPEE